MLHKRSQNATLDEDEDDQRIEYADILAKRVVYSHAHALVCASMLVAGVVEVLWILGLLTVSTGASHLPDHPLFALLEIYVTLGLVGDILLRLVLQRRDFCRQCANIVDVGVASVSIVSLVLFEAGLETPTEMLLGTIIVTGRIVFRLARLIAVSKGWRQHQRAADRKLDVQLDVCMDGGSSERLEWDVEDGGPSIA